MSETEQRFALRIVATGEVRDKDGNLLNVEPVESTVIVTAEQARIITEGQQP